MKRTLTLNQNRDFVRLYRRGASLVNPILVTYCQKNRRGARRIGITATKKVGNAVQRNRCRRVIREAFRQQPPITGGFDIVFVARGRTLAYKSTQLAPIMARHLNALGVLPL